jgi:hypothetical protein
MVIMVGGKESPMSLVAINPKSATPSVVGVPEIVPSAPVPMVNPSGRVPTTDHEVGLLLAYGTNSNATPTVGSKILVVGLTTGIVDGGVIY